MEGTDGQGGGEVDCFVKKGDGGGRMGTCGDVGVKVVVRSWCLSLQALSNLHYLFSGFMDYFWSCKLNISNFGPANRLEVYLRVFGWFFHFVYQFRDDMPYSCLIEYPKHPGSSWKSKRVGDAIGTKPDEIFGESEKVFPGEAGK
nr:hypothetical protein [Tanacetum cinerariifolium]